MQARRQFRYRGPSAWAELSPKQFLQVIAWQLKLEGAPAGLFALLQLWYRIPYLVLRALDDEQRTRLLGLLDFLETLPDGWLLPRLRVGWQTRLGPGDKLRHLTFGAFMFAEAALQAGGANPQTDHLVDLAASIYAPRALPFGPLADGGRQPYDRQQLKAQIRWAAQLPHPVLMGVWQLYVGNRAHFPQVFPHLFRPATAGSGGGATWLDVGLSLARQTGALGTFNELEKQPVYLALTMLDALIKEADELKKAYAS